MTKDKVLRLYSLKQKEKELEAEIATLSKELLKEMQDEKVSESKFDDKIITLCKKVTIVYKDENSLMRFLEEHNYAKYIEKSIKTQSFNTFLKSGSKKSKELNESLGDLVEKKVTEYVQVTTEESKERQQKHIEEKIKEAASKAETTSPDFVKYLKA